MGIMDIFRGQPAQGQEGQQAQQQGQNQQGQQGQQEQQAPQEPQGLDRWNELFTPGEKDHKPTNFDPSALFNISAESQSALEQEIGKLNFVQGAVTPEITKAFEAGGDDAIKAIPALVNNVAKQAFSAALQASLKMQQSAFTKAAPAMEGRMQDLLRERNFSSAVREANPILSHPTAKPIVDALIPALTAKYPNASTDEIKKLAGDFVTDLVSAGVPKTSESDKSDKMSFDWDGWFKGTPSTT